MAFAGAWGFLREEQRRTQTLMAVMALCMVLAGYAMQTFVQDVPLLREEDFCDTRIEQYEYLYEGTQKDVLVPGEIRAAEAPDFAVYDVHKQGTNLSFRLDAPQGLAYLELPLLYYPGYAASAGGSPCRVVRGDNNVIRLYGVPSGMDIAISVRYAQPLLWKLACAASLLGAAALAALCLRSAGKRA